MSLILVVVVVTIAAPNHIISTRRAGNIYEHVISNPVRGEKSLITILFHKVPE
jgi:hypothetical protein